jgi:hypothetical protein
MLKTILDSLAGVRSESDPTVGKLEAGEWESDIRDQLTQHVSEPFIVVLPGPMFECVITTPFLSSTILFGDKIKKKQSANQLRYSYL